MFVVLFVQYRLMLIQTLIKKTKTKKKQQHYGLMRTMSINIMYNESDQNSLEWLRKCLTKTFE